VGDHQDLEDAKQDGSLTRAEAITLRDEGSDQKRVGVGLLAVGGAALTAAAVLFLSTPDDTSTSWHIGPSPGGAVLGGRF
jgi:hypothetical protein